ncbi:MAG: 1-phosphofructokinase [Chloroflexota bacterium]
MIYTVTLNPALDRELTVSEIIFDDVLRATTLRLDYGGKGFNVSRALAALGVESTALGFVGGHTGQHIAAGLAMLNIRTDFVPIAGETRTNISIVSQSQPHYIKVNEAGPAITSAEKDALLQKVQNLAQAGDWWVLSGSLPPGMSPAIYAEIISIVQSAGAEAILDTSGAPLRYGCQAGPFLAKPNAAEAAELTGLKQAATQPPIVARAIHALGVKNVLISLGKAGAIFSDGEQLWLTQAPEIEEQNPIGAGDSAVAGLVWGLSHHLDWSEILRRSMACGAATASLAGTAVGPKELVEQLAKRVKVAEISTLNLLGVE